MRVRTLEIRWHDSKPINSCDFQPVPIKRARPVHEKDFISQSYRLATGGEDNNIRIWMVHPNILPPSVAEGASTSTGSSPKPHPPRVEYLATLSRHSAPVNVVRFSPNGELIASAGDDGMIIIWSPSSTPQTSAYGSESVDLQYEKEYWKARTPFRCTTMQVYDLAWSPTGEFIVAGSTDNTARIFTASDGKCIRELAEHSHFVQGVAWDPLNEYLATQSSDRSVHVYSVSARSNSFDIHAVGRNARMTVRHSRTPSVGTRPRVTRRKSAASDAESAITTASEHAREREREKGKEKEKEREDPHPPPVAVPLTPAPSIASTPSASVFLPPPSDRALSRRSSFSSTAPGSPSQYSHIGRSPSPMPPLSAIRAPPSPQLIAQTRLYGDENFTNFFRRLTFSPDGGLLLTPSGHFEDPSNIPGISSWPGSNEPQRGRRGNPADLYSDPSSASSVFIYSRANFARPPIAQLPGHKKASIAVRFSPVLYELRPGVIEAATTESKGVAIAVERGSHEEVEIDMVGPPATAKYDSEDEGSPKKQTEQRASPPLPAHPSQTLPSPALSAVEISSQTPIRARPSTPSASRLNTGQTQIGSVFALPYRMLFAVATMDTISIHDTQQSGPICLLTKLHYDEFTDMSWSPDGQCLMLSSRDGYCTIVIFDQPIPAHHTQQHTLQLQSIAYSHSHGHSYTPSHIHHTSALPSAVVTPSPTPMKRSAPLPVASSSSESIGRSESAKSSSSSSLATNVEKPTSSSETEPPKKKRRVALTHVSDLDPQ